MPDCSKCNTKGKVLLGIGGLLTLAGIIVVIVAGVKMNDAVSIDWLAAGTKTASLTIDQEEHCGLSVYMKKDEEAQCTAAFDDLSVMPPASFEDWQPLKFNKCQDQDKVEQDNLVVRGVAHVFVTKGEAVQKGTWSLTNNWDMWVMDACGELGEAVGGFFASMGLIILAIVLVVVASIFCCVACCCCSAEEKGQVVVS